MRRTNQGNINGYPKEYLKPITVDTNGLQTILSCGRSTAVQIGMDAEAKVLIGRRVLWNIAKIQEYLNTVSTA